MDLPASRVFRELWDAVAGDKTHKGPALPESALPFFLARIPAPPSGRSVVVALAEREERSLPSLARAMGFWKTVGVQAYGAAPLPTVVLPLLLPQERSGDIPTPRLHSFWQVLASLRGGEPRQILATPRELQQPAPSATTDLGGLVLHEGQTLAPKTLAERLLALGYTEEKVTEEPGTFARRGGVFDVFPFHADMPIRLEYAGNVLDRIAALRRVRNGGGGNGDNGTFEAVLEKVKETGPRRWTIYPLGLPKKLTASVSGLTESAYVIAEDGVLPAARRVDLLLTPFQESDAALADAPAFAGEMKKLASAVRDRLKKGGNVFLFTARPASLSQDLPADKKLAVVPADRAADARGFSDNAEQLFVWTDGDLGEAPEEEALTWETGLAYARRFRVSDYVVHRDHGIARFRGIERKSFEHTAREYLVLEYAQRDRLFVPVELAAKVTAYVGAANPIVHRLGGVEWEETTRAVRAEASDLARELLALYASRETQAGTAYPPDTGADRGLAESFPYEETPDQAAAIREVKRDMERAQPMDRLVCGDVGFGKTEVAIRAAYKAVNFGRQVAVLSPTTLLAQQHYDTFRERLKGTGTSVALLSRFQSPAEEARVLKELGQGKVDIIIGTHRLLSDDVTFTNLGLIIIDEEQKFGVAQKEHLKNVRASVDVLSLSATPIPRTLHMALSGLRALSVIATAPTGRRPVITKVVRENDALVKKALEDELARGGQAYVLWNRVETIDAAAERIRTLIPKARVVVAHGQMAEDQLMRVMEQFDTRAEDVLVCSTIIENGIDLPNVNTLIVFDTPSFGLADLYQLRGRVGRGNQQAFAYFLYSHGRLPFEARKRLAALLESVELGSGWTLALRDLEIRGAGNLLGREQHGTIRAVGVHLFSELLGEEVERIRTGKTSPGLADVQVDLPVRAFLPETYIPNTDARLAAYTRLSSARSPTDLAEARRSLEGTYGPVPSEAAQFFSLLTVKFLAAEAGVTAIAESTVQGAPRAATIPGAARERRVTLTFTGGLTPALAYAAIADNPRWMFTGASMSIGTPELNSAPTDADSGADTGSALLENLTHILRILGDTRRKEAAGKIRVPKPKKS